MTRATARLAYASAWPPMRWRGSAADVEIAVTHADGRWIAELVLSRPAPLSRRVDAASCEQLASAVALVVVVAIDPFAVPWPEPRTPARSRDPTPTAELPRSSPTPPAPAAKGRPPRRPRILASTQLAVGLGVGALPRPTAVIAGAAGFTRGMFGLRTHVHWWTPQARDPTPAAGGRVQIWAAGTSACFVTGRDLAWWVCGGVEVGAVVGRGHGTRLNDPRLAAAPWLAGTGTAGASWPAHRRVSGFLALQAVVPVVYPAFHVQRPGDVHRVGPVAAVVSLGAEVHFSR